MYVVCSDVGQQLNPLIVCRLRVRAAAIVCHQDSGPNIQGIWISRHDEVTPVAIIT